MKNVSIKHVTFAHQAIHRGLEFYAIELVFLQRRLEEIAADNTGRKVLEKVETFQNQFVIHRDQIAQLQHRVSENYERLQHSLDPSGNYVNEKAVQDSEKISDDYATEEQLFKDMRQEFNRFAAAWL